MHAGCTCDHNHDLSQRRIHNSWKTVFWKFQHCLGNRKNRKSGSHSGRTHKLRVMSVFICCDWFYSWPCAFIRQLAWESFITICLVSQAPDPPHPSPRAGSAVSLRLPHSSWALTACITPCSAFKPAAEETHSDNYSIGAPTHREPGLHDMRWTLIEKPSGRLWGRTGSESREGYRKVRQITERGEGREEQDERWKMREMRRRWKGKIPTVEKNGIGKDLKNKAVEAGGELNIVRRIELKLSKNNTNWRKVWHKADA